MRWPEQDQYQGIIMSNTFNVNPSYLVQQCILYWELPIQSILGYLWRMPFRLWAVGRAKTARTKIRESNSERELVLMLGPHNVLDCIPTQGVMSVCISKLRQLIRLSGCLRGSITSSQRHAGILVRYRIWRDKPWSETHSTLVSLDRRYRYSIVITLEPNKPHE